MGRSRFKLPRITPLFWFSSSKESRIHQGKHSGRMIFGCQAFNNVSQDVQSPLPAKKSRLKRENRICSSPTNRKGSHACSRLTATGISSKQSHSSNPCRLDKAKVIPDCGIRRLDKAAKVIPDCGILAPENHGIFGTSMRHARRGSNKSNEGADHVKARRSLSFSCDSTSMRPQAAGCSENRCGPEKTSAAEQNLDTPIDEWEKDEASNVLNTVKNNNVRKRVVLPKTKGYKRMEVPSLNDASDASKVNEQKVGHCARVDSAGSETREASSLCGYRLGTSSVDASLDVEQNARDRDPSSFTSDSSCLRRSFAEEAACTGSFSHTGESADSSIFRAVEKHQFCETLAGENASVGFKLQFRSVGPKLAKETRRKGIRCTWTAKRKGQLLSRSYKMSDRLGDKFPAFSKDDIEHPRDPESSSKLWINPIPSKIIQRRDCNSVLLENSARSLFYSSRALSTTTKISRMCNCSREHNPDPPTVKATDSPVSVTNNERAAACKKAQCCSRGYTEAPLQIVPSNMKKMRNVKESIAVVKSSYNPYEDFRTSMLEMIFSKKIQEPAKLKELLECYIALNSPSYRELIIAAFENVCHQIFIFSKASIQSISPPSHFSTYLEKNTKQSPIIRG